MVRQAKLDPRNRFCSTLCRVNNAFARTHYARTNVSTEMLVVFVQYRIFRGSRQSRESGKTTRGKQKKLKVVGTSLDSLLRPSIDRSQGSVSAFQPAMLIISWQGACDTYGVLACAGSTYIQRRVRRPTPRTISCVDSAGVLCEIIAGQRACRAGGGNKNSPIIRDVLFIKKIARIITRYSRSLRFRSERIIPHARCCTSGNEKHPLIMRLPDRRASVTH